MSSKKRGLGRGLDALLNTVGATSAEPAPDTSAGQELAVALLQPGRHQPRRHFDDAALDELAASIRAQGVVQPIVVRPIENGRYEIVAGERRWRAAQRAGLATIPAVVRNLDDRSAMAIALVENIQRADLNPLEEAEALTRLIDDCKLTHEQCAQAVGKSRASVTNLLRILDLNEDVRGWVRDGTLSLGHAKVLLGVEAERQLVLARQVVERRLSVRQLEGLLALAGSARNAERPTPSPWSARFAGKLGMRAEVRSGPRGGGKLVVQFKTERELQALLDRIQ